MATQWDKADPPNVAVIGCGYWGINLVRNFQQLGALYTVCDESPEALNRARQQLPGISTSHDYQAVLADPKVDGIVLTTPAATHFSMAWEALAAGKDVFVEKPLALEVSEGEQLIRLAEDQRRILMVGHILRYHPALLKLKELVQQGFLGDIQYIYSHRLNLGKVRQEENVLWSFAPHDISSILYLLESMPLGVSSTGGTYLQQNIVDVTISNLLFDKGVRAHIFVSWLHPFKEQRLVVIGTKNMAVFEDLSPTSKLTLYDKRIEKVNGTFLTQRPIGAPVPIASTEPLHNECRHFLECISTRATPLTDGQEGLRVVTVLQALQHSLQSAGESVDVVWKR